MPEGLMPVSETGRAEADIPANATRGPGPRGRASHDRREWPAAPAYVAAAAVWERT